MEEGSGEGVGELFAAELFSPLGTGVGELGFDGAGGF
jgi:hypothetical protein